MNSAIAAVELLEGMFGAIRIDEGGNEATKNMAVESLRSLSDALDLVKQNVQTAMDNVKNLGIGPVDDRLVQLSQNIDSSVTNVAELIALATGTGTKEDLLAEDDGDDSGVKMNIDDATKDLQDVKKITDGGVNVILDDTIKEAINRLLEAFEPLSLT